MPALLYKLAFFLWLVSLSACHSQIEPLRLQGQTMGTTWSAIIVKGKGQSLPQAGKLKTALEQQLKQVNNQMSTWQKDSELSLFNQYSSTDWFPVSAELVHVVNEAGKLSRQSEGAYDVTLGALVNLWGFGAARESKEAKIPDAQAIEAAKAKVGYQLLETRKNPPALRKQNPELYVDLSSIAKGYGVDQLGEYLESQGIKNYMVEIGGEIRTRGHSARGEGQLWRLAIEKPTVLGSQTVQQGMQLSNSALATSGDYRNFFAEGGQRYSHTIDPLSGYSVRHNLASVSVLAENTLLADGYATLLMALGEVKGLEFANKHQLAAYFIWRTNEGFETAVTPGFEKHLLKQSKASQE